MKKKIIYIAGYGRSGSSILALILGQHKNIISLGEIGVILINLSHEKFIIKSGERIAQMVISKHEQVKWEVTESLPKSNRGGKGFGSTGK